MISVLLLVALSCSDGPEQAPGNGSVAITPPPAKPGVPAFPRTAVYFLEHENLPSAAELARYDVVVLDSEWDNRLPARFFTDLRAANPDVQLLAYVNLVDRPARVGGPDRWADRYALWQFASDTESRFPDQWLAKTADGSHVSEWPDSVMTNLSDRAPRVNGQTYAEYAADWVVNQVWATGVWDGIFLDVWGDRIFGASHTAWDVDRDGTDEPDTEIYGVGNPWERGIDGAERILRQRLPDAVLVANGDRTLHNQQLDGRVWESFADPESGRDPAFDVQSYVTVTSEDGHRMPGTALTISRQRGVTPGSAEDARRGRFFLTATLLQDGYWASMATDYGALARYDELDGGGVGSGYLGYPLRPNPSADDLQAPFANGVGQVADRVFRRDFTAGIVLCNLSGETRTVTLDRPYRKLPGTLDTKVNDGSRTETVTLAPYDGLILLR